MGMSTRLAVMPAIALAPPEETTAAEVAPSRSDGVDWNAQMRRHGHRVVVALLARGIRPARAKELAQDAWLRVIEQHRHGRLPELKLPGVVIAQATFLAMEERRRTEQRIPHDPLGADELMHRAHLEPQVVARAQLRAVARVVEASHPNARRVFELMYGGEARTAAEIAASLGLSVQRVRQIACELRQRVRLALGEEGGAP